MQGGDRTTGKYAQRQKSDGRYYLDNIVDELICHLTVQGETDKAIVRLVDEIAHETIDQERIDAVRSTILAERRMKWLKKEKDRDDGEPETPQECVQFARQNLVRIIKSKIDTKDRIAANKALVEVSLKQMEMKQPDGPAKKTNSALDQLIGGK